LTGRYYTHVAYSVKSFHPKSDRIIVCYQDKETFLFPFHLPEERASQAVTKLPGKCALNLAFAKCSGYSPAIPPGVLASVYTVIFRRYRRRADPKLVDFVAAWLPSAIFDFPAILLIHGDLCTIAAIEINP